METVTLCFRVPRELKERVAALLPFYNDIMKSQGEVEGTASAIYRSCLAEGILRMENAASAKGYKIKQG